jgi:hypothetical protein
MRRAFKLIVATAAVAAICAPRRPVPTLVFSPWAAVQFGGRITRSRGCRPRPGRVRCDRRAGWARASSALKSTSGAPELLPERRNDFGNNTVIDVMGNIIIGIPIGGTTGGGVRPYSPGGVGTDSVTDRWRDAVLQRIVVDQRVRLEREAVASWASSTTTSACGEIFAT